jgi:hypothetical protein
MKFEIVNPSDPYTMESESVAVAAVVCTLIGQGKYSLKEIGGTGENDVPFFMFGGLADWFIEKTGGDFGAFYAKCIADGGEELARAFDSVKLESPFERSSLNDIGARAKAYAEHVRAQAKAGQP